MNMDGTNVARLLRLENSFLDKIGSYYNVCID